MENKEDAFWSDRSDALETITTNNQLALFDRPMVVEITEPFLTCKIEAIPGKYFKGQFAMTVKKGFQFSELFNIVILKLRETGIQSDIFNTYHGKKRVAHSCGKREKGSGLGMKSVISAVIIQLVGIILPIFIFFGEVAWKFYT